MKTKLERVVYCLVVLTTRSGVVFADDFRGIDWGTPRHIVREILQTPILADGRLTIRTHDQIEELDVDVSYQFFENCKLLMGTSIAPTLLGSEGNDKRLRAENTVFFGGMIRRLTEKYGDFQWDCGDVKPETLPMNQYMEYVEKTKNSCKATWLQDRTTIELFLGYIPISPSKNAPDIVAAFVTYQPSPLVRARLDTLENRAAKSKF